MGQEQVYPYGEPVVTGVLKSSPMDFQVTEELGFEPQGEGEHLFLWVEKTGLSTAQLIERIARDHSLKPQLIGYSGLKDKHAVTRQWLSLHLPGKPSPTELGGGDGYRVLRQARHHKKLRPGTHKFNAFQLRLREVKSLPDRTREQLQCVADQGFANYFGAQRFGRKQDNVRQALKQLNTRRLKRSRKSILLSSLRSYLFNQILARRISLGHWEQPLAGDVFMLHGSHSIFADKLDDKLIARYQQLDVASTASLYGAGASLLSGEASAIEAQIFSGHDEITHCLDQQGTKLKMRSLRAVVDKLNFDYDAKEKSLSINLVLPTGCYVTTLLDHCINLQDVS